MSPRIDWTECKECRQVLGGSSPGYPYPCPPGYRGDRLRKYNGRDRHSLASLRGNDVQEQHAFPILREILLSLALAGILIPLLQHCASTRFSASSPPAPCSAPLPGPHGGRRRLARLVALKTCVIAPLLRLGGLSWGRAGRRPAARPGRQAPAARL